MKYKHKMNRIKTTTGRRWYKRTLKRSERAKAQAEVQNQINELLNAMKGRDPYQWVTF